ncbi:MAG: hydrogenase small subunit [Chloroflexota bacterium]
MSSSEVQEIPAIWLQAAGCTGCSVSLLNTSNPSIKNLLLEQVLPMKHINLRFHPTLMAGAGKPVVEILDDSAKGGPGEYILIVEGAIPTAHNGVYGTTGERNGEPVTMMARASELARRASVVVALGTCAAFGGIPAAHPNPAGCVSVAQALHEQGINTPVINIPGCPPHPDWFVRTIATLLLTGLPGELDEYKRPKAFYGKTIHENCPRRAYYDENKFATKFGEDGCNYYLGCRGPVTYADCPLRLWNDKVNWCVGCGSTCIGCTEAAFPDGLSPLYEKLSPPELPEDM